MSDQSNSNAAQPDPFGESNADDLGFAHGSFDTDVRMHRGAPRG